MNRYQKLEEILGISFKDRKLLNTGFVHKSYLNECPDPDLKDNERLEFLGDAVLELIVTEYLYASYDRPEGELTNWRSALVKGKNLAQIGLELSLGDYLYLSKGEQTSGGAKKNYILANTLEALLGVIYLDQGYETAKNFVKKYILKYLEEIIEKGLHIDPKSLLQEIAQEKLNLTPEYRLISESGPDHEKNFVMGAYLGEELCGMGSGSSKQTAEQEAATDALNRKGWK